MFSPLKIPIRKVWVVAPESGSEDHIAELRAVQ